MLDIVVCVKAVPDPRRGDLVRIDPVTKTLARTNGPLVMNLLDKHALEAALRIKEQHAARVRVLSMGPSAAAEIIIEGLALGADQGFLLNDAAFAGADAFATARILAQGIVEIGSCDLVLCGMSSSDGSTGWVGPMLGVFLGLPVVTRVEQILDKEGLWWTVKASLETGYRIVRVALPAVLTVTRDLNQPRVLKFSGIVGARAKPLKQMGLAELGLSQEHVGLRGSPTVVSEMTVRARTSKAEIIPGSREEKAEGLVQKLMRAGVLT